MSRKLNKKQKSSKREKEANKMIDPKDAKKYIGKRVIVGINYYNQNREVINRIQFHGIIKRINTKEGIVIRPHKKRNYFTLPLDLSSLKKAAKVTYKLESTGEVVENPDFVCVWSVTKPPPGKRNK